MSDDYESPRQLTDQERSVLLQPLTTQLDRILADASDGDDDLRFALRRAVIKFLQSEEKLKPAQRQRLRFAKWREQKGLCAKCQEDLPEKGFVLDRLVAKLGYTQQNVRALCTSCDTAVQAKRRYS